MGGKKELLEINPRKSRQEIQTDSLRFAWQAWGKWDSTDNVKNKKNSLNYKTLAENCCSRIHPFSWLCPSFKTHILKDTLIKGLKGVPGFTDWNVNFATF